jgi:CheY-like chemotaxis protein
MLPVLVVEDHNINRDVAVLQLTALGLDCHCVASGDEALVAIKKNTYCLILMDVMMPGMDGWETSRAIRAYEAGIGMRTPIVAVSAWAAADNKKQCLEAGMDDYLSKPYTRDDLKKIVERWAKTVV